ncbi:MAG: DUF2344 domain-containing protein [Deltaproteobacteria bacterium]|nr:DUF2344 domain-containing protein [Deltaproteobacteria bacterium]
MKKPILPIATDLDHPRYGSWLLQIQRPSRYVGCEYDMVAKHGPLASRMVLAFPDLYDIGMSHLGLRILYQVVNSVEDLALERAFMPWQDMEEALRTRHVPLCSLETARPLSDFDLVGFSLQYELTFSNVLAMLDLGGLPLRSNDRTETDPIVIAGGPVASHAEMLAPFVDLFLVGDAEQQLVELMRIESDLRQRGISRQDRIAALDEMEPCYAPARHPTMEVAGCQIVQTPSSAVDEVIPIDRLAAHDHAQTDRLVADDEHPTDRFVARRAVVENLDDWPDSSGGPVPSIEAVFDRISFEVMRGCTQGCRFCQAGILYRPVREMNVEQVERRLTAAIHRTGWDEIALTGLSPADHSQLFEIFHQAAALARPIDVSLSVSALRAYGLPGDFLDDLRTGRGGSLTFAPEAGTERLRNVINKNVTNEDLLATTAAVARRGWSRIKLYFMMGLPTETDEDLEAIAELGEQVYRTARSAAPGRPPTVTCSMSTFVAKPHTPFQWEAVADFAEIRRRQKVIKRAAKGKHIKLRFHEPSTTILEAIFGRADRAMADVLETAYRRGARFDGWEELLDWRLWRELFEEANLDVAQFLAPIDEDAALAWDHIDVRISKQFLSAQRALAFKERPTPPCGIPGPKGAIRCYDCGADCDLDAIAARYEAAARVRTEPKNHPMPMVPSQPKTERVRLRLQFAKTGPATLWSHLSLVRHLPRTLRRADLQMAYSAGFHPKPQMRFGPPLPVGWQGLAELVDVDLKSVSIPGDLDDLTARLDPLAPPGLTFQRARILEPQESTLGKLIRQVRYHIDLIVPDRNVVMERLTLLDASDTVVIERQTKRGWRKLDLKAGIRSIVVGDSLMHNPSTEAIAGDLVSLDLTTDFELTPASILLWLCDPLSVFVTRLGFATADGRDPF